MTGFFFAYLRRELRRRLRHVLLIAAALGASVGLVMTVSAASAAVARAQDSLLRSLYGIGTGLTVTESVRHPGALQDPGALLPGDLGPMPRAVVANIARLAHVAGAVGGLRLTELKPTTGGIPQAIAVSGVDPASRVAGPLAGASMASGRGFAAADGNADLAVVAADYAAASKVSVGSRITVAGAVFRVIGLVRQGGDSAQIYLPLRVAQRLARSADGTRLNGSVNVVYAVADSAAHVAELRREITRELPGVTVTSAADLAAAVTGSLSGAASLAGSLGRWVSAAALCAAVGVAVLFTSAAVTRRAREFGTLKALGWPTRRILCQVMGESAATGIIGAAAGVMAGLAGIGTLNALAPALSATAPHASGPVIVRLAAHVTPGVVAITAGAAVGATLAAGCFGAWRAARFAPADAFGRTV